MADTEVKDVKEEVAHEEEGNDEVCLVLALEVGYNCALGDTLGCIHLHLAHRLSLAMVGLNILDSGNMGIKGQASPLRVEKS